MIYSKSHGNFWRSPAHCIPTYLDRVTKVDSYENNFTKSILIEINFVYCNEMQLMILKQYYFLDKLYVLDFRLSYFLYCTAFLCLFIILLFLYLMHDLKLVTFMITAKSKVNQIMYTPSHTIF